MISKHNKNLVPNAKELRKNMTKEERHLWYDLLKKLPYNVRRQHGIERYIVDFYIAKKKLVIELDGIQHSSPEHKKADEERDAVLSRWGLTVLRYSNNSVRNQFQAVAADILMHLGLSFSDLNPR